MGKVAQVGMHRPATAEDVRRIAMAIELVGDVMAQEPDPVNLAYGRDFLRERERYDAVIVHSVFHTHDTYMKHAKKLPSMKDQISPHHSIGRWRRRLASTGARVIVVFETIPLSLNGWQLEKLRGYRIKERNAIYTIYEREGGA